jgi:hypothetical protein
MSNSNRNSIGTESYNSYDNYQDLNVKNLMKLNHQQQLFTMMR